MSQETSTSLNRRTLIGFTDQPGHGAVDQCGQVIDVLLSEQRDTAAARRFFVRALTHGPASTGRCLTRQTASNP
jgi:hypothetical protein